MSRLRQTTLIAILSAIGLVLMMFDVPLFPSAPYLKYDAGDIPVLIGAFALGPVTGIMVALLKNLLFLMVRGTPETWFVGAPMNALAGASFALVAGNLYFLDKTKVRAVVSLVAGGLFSTLVMALANLLVLPFFLHFFMPAAKGVSMELVLWVIVPFNLLKAGINGVLVFMVYKRISPVLKAVHWELPARTPRRRAAVSVPVAPT